MARSRCTYALLLSLGWGACPQLVVGQDLREPEPLPAPLLPAEEAWVVDLPSPPSAQAVMDGPRAYVPLAGGQLLALNRETGATEWSAAVESSWPVAVGDGVVYVAGDRSLQAVHASSGLGLWTVPFATPVMAPPTLRSGMLLVLAKPDEIRALRASDGSEIWKRALGGAPESVSIVTDATSAYASSGGRLIRLALSGGALQWERHLPGDLGPPTLANGRVVVGSTDNNLYAFDSETGRLAWRWRTGGDVVGAASDGRFVYVASLDNQLRALRTGSGNQAWKRDVSTRTIAPPLTFGGILVVSGNDPTLSTFDTTTGAPIATLSAPADLMGAPLVDTAPQPYRVAIVALTRDGRAIGFRPTGLMFREVAPVPLATLPGRALEREPRSLIPNP